MLSQAKIAAELALEDAINAARLLLGPQLASVIRFAIAAATGARLTMGAGDVTPLLKAAFWAEASLPLQKQFFTFTPA
jgi:nucleotidyltransferase/DNA polymerase involved in DNA repair